MALAPSFQTNSPMVSIVLCMRPAQCVGTVVKHLLRVVSRRAAMLLREAGA